MTVYLIAYHETPKRPLSFLEQWTKAIKGDVDHVEIAFVHSRALYSCYITKGSVVAKFGERVVDRMLQEGTITWYKLEGISPAMELELEERCIRLVGSATPCYFSQAKMLHSAMPFVSPALDRVIAKWAEPFEAAKLERAKATMSAQDVVQLEVADKSAWAPHARSTYCGELCAQILGLPAPERRTASDVVVLCLQQLGAKPVPKPVFDTPQRPTHDDAQIVRSAQPLRWLLV